MHYKQNLTVTVGKKNESDRKVLVCPKYFFICCSLAALQSCSVENGSNSSKLMRTVYFAYTNYKQWWKIELFWQSRLHFTNTYTDRLWLLQKNVSSQQSVSAGLLYN